LSHAGIAEVKRSTVKVTGYKNSNGARLLVPITVHDETSAFAGGLGLHVDTTAYVF